MTLSQGPWWKVNTIYKFKQIEMCICPDLKKKRRAIWKMEERNEKGQKSGKC